MKKLLVLLPLLLTLNFGFSQDEQPSEPTQFEQIFEKIGKALEDDVINKEVLSDISDDLKDLENSVDVNVENGKEAFKPIENREDFDFFLAFLYALATTFLTQLGKMFPKIDRYKTIFSVVVLAGGVALAATVLNGGFEVGPFLRDWFLGGSGSVFLYEIVIAIINSTRKKNETQQAVTLIAKASPMSRIVKTRQVVGVSKSQLRNLMIAVVNQKRTMEKEGLTKDEQANWYQQVGVIKALRFLFPGSYKEGVGLNEDELELRLEFPVGGHRTKA